MPNVVLAIRLPPQEQYFITQHKYRAYSILCWEDKDYYSVYILCLYLLLNFLKTLDPIYKNAHDCICQSYHIGK